LVIVADGFGKILEQLGDVGFLPVIVPLVWWHGEAVVLEDPGEPCLFKYGLRRLFLHFLLRVSSDLRNGVELAGGGSGAATLGLLGPESC
jgi:hypothetical protein